VANTISTVLVNFWRTLRETDASRLSHLAKDLLICFARSEDFKAFPRSVVIFRTMPAGRKRSWRPVPTSSRVELNSCLPLPTDTGQEGVAGRTSAGHDQGALANPIRFQSTAGRRRPGFLLYCLPDGPYARACVSFRGVAMKRLAAF